MIFVEKRSVFQEGLLRLHPSKIHLMQLISERPDLSAGQMAQRLDVSNRAISQTLARLQRKRIVENSKDPFLKQSDRVLYSLES